ncbi:MAG: DinB family protein [Armatimonadota bacterium]|nr:DinB family protein [Armatimonadota bacterium]
MTQAVLIDLATRAFERSPWHSLMAALEEVTLEAFTALPQRNNGFPWMDGSIRDIVYHVTGDKLVQVNHAFGDGDINWENISIHKTDKETMMADLVASHSIVIQAIKRTDDLQAKVTGWGGKRLSAVDFFVMLIEHDLYHAGQIRYIRNLVE